MATHPVSVANAAVDAVVDLVDAGTTDTTGDIVLRNASNEVVVTLNMSNPAFGDAASRVATAGTISPGTVPALPANGGVVTNCQIRDRDNSEVIAGTVGETGAEITISNATLAEDDQVSMSSLTYTGPN